MNPRNGETIENIKQNYERLERDLINQLYIAIPHGGELGNYRETIWGNMFEMIVPKKFVIEQSVFIIDSFGRVSRQVDLAIIDQMYTPYIFRYEKLKFIPIEAVAVVVECKSQTLPKDKLKEWAQSIKELSTSRNSYARIVQKIAIGNDNGVPTQSATRPLRILCCLNKSAVNEELDDGDRLFDFILRATSANDRLKVEIDDHKENLYDWYFSLNHADVKKKELPQEAWEQTIAKVRLAEYQVTYENRNLNLMSFNFQLNQLLMLINNPMMFPHMDYAKMFGGKRGEEKE